LGSKPVRSGHIQNCCAGPSSFQFGRKDLTGFHRGRNFGANWDQNLSGLVIFRIAAPVREFQRMADFTNAVGPDHAL
jgi:hypothetical protein